MLIKSYFNKKLKKPFFTNVLTLLSGSLIAQLIIFLSIPFLTRMFSEESFGIYALFSSTIILLKTISTLNFELAIILPKRDKDAINIFFFNILLISFFNILLVIFIYFFKTDLASIFKIEKLSNFIFLIPLSVFLGSIITALEYWNTRNNMFTNISIGVVSKSTTMTSSQLLIGISNFKSFGLIPGMVVGLFFNFIFLIKLSITSILNLWKHVSIKRMFFLISKYRDIPLFNTLLTFISNLSNEIPVIFISNFFGFSYTGIYSLASKFAKTPPGIIGQSISTVFFNEASKTFNSGGNLYQLLKKIQKKLFFTALIIFSPIFIISFYLNYILGDNWIETGLYVRILLPLLFISFLLSPVSSIITILNKQKIILVIDLIKLFLRFIALYIGFRVFNSIFVSLSLFSGIGVVFNLIILIYFFKIAKNSKQSSFKAYSD